MRLRKDARSGLGGVVGGNNRHEIETITNVQNDAELGGRRVSGQTSLIPCGLDRYTPGESTMHKVSTVATHLCARRALGGEADRGPSRAQLH